MEKLDVANIRAMLEVMTQVIIDNEVAFCELDSAAGDGDFGMSIAKGFNALKKEWAELPNEDIGALLKACAMVIMEHCGGASGPIWGSAFNGAARSAKGKAEATLAEFAEMGEAAVAAIKKKGGAKEGDKTLLDALIPAVRTLREEAEAGSGIDGALSKAAQSAVDGAEATRKMVASRGRASYVGERSLDHPDAGAFALGVIFTEVASKTAKEG